MAKPLGLKQLAALLAPDEQVIWQGWPETSAPMPKAQARFWLFFGGIFALVGAIFLIVSMVAGKDAVTLAVFGGMGAVFFCIGLAAILLPRWLYRRRLSKTRYLLSNQRAIILENKRSRSFPITPETMLDHELGTPGSVYFGQEDTALRINGRPVTAPVGFIAVSEAPQIVAAIHALQREMAQTPPRQEPTNV